jgi:hypothetical protein
MIHRNEKEQIMAEETFVESVPRGSSSVGGAVTLLFGGGLSALGAYRASQTQTGPLSARWAREDFTKMAAAISASRIATSGTKLAINSRYHLSGVGIAADVFSAAQLTIFAIGRWYQPRPTTGGYANAAALIAAIAQQPSPIKTDHRYVTDEGIEYDTFEDDTTQVRIRRVG